MVVYVSFLISRLTPPSLSSSWVHMSLCLCLYFCPENRFNCTISLVVKKLPANAGDIRDAGSVPRSGRSPEEGMATHSSILAWRIPWTEEPGRLQSIASQSWTRLKWLSTYHFSRVHIYALIYDIRFSLPLTQRAMGKRLLCFPA